MTLCPKCNSKLANYQGASICGGLNQTEGNRATIINGQSCLICGTWVEEEMQVVCPYRPARYQHPPKKIVPATPSRRVRFADIQEQMKPHIREITRLRSKGVSWPRIGKLFDIEASPTLIKKAYLAQIRRAA